MIWLNPSIERPTQHSLIKNTAESTGAAVESIKILKGCVGLRFGSDLSDSEQKDVADALGDQLGGVWEIIDEPDDPLDTETN